MSSEVDSVSLLQMSLTVPQEFEQQLPQLAQDVKHAYEFSNDPVLLAKLRVQIPDFINVTKKSGTCRGHCDACTEFWFCKTKAVKFLQIKIIEWGRQTTVKAVTCKASSMHIQVPSILTDSARRRLVAHGANLSAVPSEESRLKTFLFLGILEFFYRGQVKYFHHDWADDCCHLSSRTESVSLREVQEQVEAKLIAVVQAQEQQRKEDRRERLASLRRSVGATAGNTEEEALKDRSSDYVYLQERR